MWMLSGKALLSAFNKGHAWPGSFSQAVTGCPRAPRVCSWLSTFTCPSSSRGLAMNTLAKHITPPCHHPLGRYGHHSQSCAQGPHQHKHDRVRNAWADFLHQSGWHYRALRQAGHIASSVVVLWGIHFAQVTRAVIASLVSALALGLYRQHLACVGP